MAEANYSYLTITIFVALLGVALVFISAGARRKFILWCGILGAPTGLADYWFVPEYWQPEHIIGTYFSIEGILFSFGNGVIVGFLAWSFVRPIMPQEFCTGNLFNCLRRFVITMIPGSVVFVLLWEGRLGFLPIMTAAFVGFIAIIIGLIIRRRFNLFIALTGTLFYSLFHLLQIVSWRLFDPDIALFWGGDYLFAPLPITGLPGDEMVWAAFYGLLWPHIIAVTLGAKEMKPFAIYRKQAIVSSDKLNLSG